TLRLVLRPRIILIYGSRLELSRTLSYGSRSRLKLKAKYRITFLSYNLLTEAENVVRQRRIRPSLLTLNLRY
ncbi:hypothetical protein ACO2JS_17910, partial [Leptospira interrogans]